MLAIKKARKLIEKSPESPTARTLSALIIALETEQSFPLKTLYQLKLDDFDLAMDVLKEWRLDRYYMSKVRLMDASLVVEELRTAPPAAAQ
jgi:flagellar biosynthesis/type III secretory pathway protein FliH